MNLNRTKQSEFGIDLPMNRDTSSDAHLSLRSLLAIAVAEIDSSGRLIEANDGFYHVINRLPNEPLGNVSLFFANPAFERLACALKDTSLGGVIYQGLITFLDSQGVSRSLTGSVVRHGDHLYLTAEHDVRENERIAAEVMHLNAELGEQQRALNRANRLLAKEKVEQERLNTELSKAMAQLVQTEKLTSIGQMAAGVAHEINNPIGFVRSNLATLGDYVHDLLAVIDAYALADDLARKDPSVWEGIERARKHSDIDFLREDVVALMSQSREGISRVTQIVQDLKDFSCIDNAEWQLADIHACLDSVLNVAAHKIRDTAEVVREYGTLPLVYCCPSQLNQVFMNLILNAVEALETPGQIVLRSGQENNEVWIEIQDTGHGIAPNQLQRIFDPFYTTRPVGSGMGLGLSSSWGVVSKHHGRIDVRSEPGKGSCFRIVLPIKSKQT